MVDVWEELGKSLGRALKPLADMGGLLMRSLGAGAGDLMRSLLGSVGTTKDTTKATIAPYMTEILDEASTAVGPGSPPKEIEEAAKKFADALLKKLQENVPKKGSSPPTLQELQIAVALITTGNFVLYAGTHAISMALDGSHLFKDWGFKAATMDIMHTFSVQDVVGPMVQAPLWSGVIAPLRMRMNQLHPYAVPGTGDLARLRAQGLIEKELYTEAASFYALDAEWADRMLQSQERVPDFGDLREMLWRKAKDEPAVRAALVKNQVRSDFIDAYLELTKAKVGSGDLITMVVREAFIPRAGDEEMPQRFVDEMAKWGYDRDACLWHWRSHWRLPALAEVFDMHHREISMPYTVESFLKWADYSPEWRGPLEKLSWRLPGRIDARWMYRWGVIDVDGLRDLLEKGGLDPEYAGDVAQATAKNQWLTEINKLRDNSKSDYAKGYILEEQLRANLEALGYPKEWIDFHVRDAVEDATRAYNAAYVDQVGDGYLKDLITEEELRMGLADVIVRPEVLELEVQRLYVTKYKKPAAPKAEKAPVVPVSTLTSAYRDEVITEAAFRDELLSRGYSPEDVELMIDVVKAKIAKELTVKPIAVKLVSVGTLRTAYREKLITEAALRAELISRGYSEADAELMIAIDREKM